MGLSDIKNYLENAEDRLLKKTLAPKTSPKSNWSYFKFIKISTWLLIWSFGPVCFVSSVISSWINSKDFSSYSNIFIIPAAIWIVLFGFFKFSAFDLVPVCNWRLLKVSDEEASLNVTFPSFLVGVNPCKSRRGG